VGRVDPFPIHPSPFHSDMKQLGRIIVILCLLGAGIFILLRLLGDSPQSLQARADEYYEGGRYEEALLVYRKLLGKDAENAHAYRRAGLIWMKRGVPRRAISYLQEALKLEPGHLEARKNRAEALLALGSPIEARREALAVLDRAPGDPEAILLLANTSAGEEGLAEVRARLAALDPEADAVYHLAEAVVLDREGKSGRVKSALDRARKLDARAADVHLALASYYRSRGEPERQLAALRQATEAAEQRSGISLRLAQALIRQDEVTEARRVIEGIRKRRGDYLPALTAMAGLEAREGRHDEALRVLGEVFRYDPVNVEAATIETQVHLAMGEPAKAVAAYERLDDAYPDNPRIKLVMAGLHLRNGDEGKAQDALRAALESAPETSRDHAEAVTRMAELDLRSGDAAAAATRLEALVVKQPDCDPGRLLLARAYEAGGRPEKAADLFREQTERKPDDPQGYLMLGRVLKRQENRLAEARETLGQAQRMAPANQTIAAELIDLDLREGDAAAAHARVQPFLDGEKPDWHAWFLKGVIFSAEEKWAEAEKALDNALELKPGSLSAYDLLVSNYLRAGSPDSAIARLEEFLAKEPNSIRHLMLLSLLLEAQGEYERAASNYRKILDEHPRFVPALNNLAYIRAESLVDFEEAEKLARKAHTIAEDNPFVADTLGWALVRQDDEAKLREGLALLRIAAAALSDSPEVLYHLGTALGRSGAREEARSALEKAVAAGGDFNGKDEARKLLEAFGGTVAPGQSVAELESMRKADPLNLPVRLELGRLYDKKGDSEQAIAAYQEAVNLDTDNLEALKALATLHEADRPDEARKYAGRAWKADPSDPEAAALQGRWAMADGLHGQAYTLLKEAAGEGASPAMLVEFATAAYSLGKVAEAREVMRRIPAGVPESGAAEVFLQLTGATDDEEAAGLEEAAEDILRTNPSHVPALMVRAARLKRAGQTADAVAVYEDVARRRPDFHPATVRLAALYAGDPARLDEAEELALQALDKSGGSAELHRVLGEVLARKGDSEAAVRYLERCKPDLDAEGLFFLGKACLESERTAEGKEALESALQAGLQDELAETANTLLRSGNE